MAKKLKQVAASQAVRSTIYPYIKGEKTVEITVKGVVVATITGVKAPKKVAKKKVENKAAKKVAKKSVVKKPAKKVAAKKTAKKASKKKK